MVVDDEVEKNGRRERLVLGLFQKRNRVPLLGVRMAHDAVPEALDVVFTEIEVVDEIKPKVQVVHLVLDVLHEEVKGVEVDRRLGAVGEDLPKCGKSV